MEPPRRKCRRARKKKRRRQAPIHVTGHAGAVLIESLELLQRALHTMWQCALLQIVEL